MKMLLLAAGLVAGCSGAFASGNDLLNDCSRAERVMDGSDEKPPDVAAGMRCMGVVKGAQDMATLAASLDRKSSMAACPPGDGTLGQSVRVTIKFMRSHPEMLNLQDGWLVTLALRDAFPCK